MTTETTGEAGQTQTGEGSQPKVDAGAEILKLQKQLETVVAERDKLRVTNRELKTASTDGAGLQKQLDDLLAEKSKLFDEYTAFKDRIKQERLDSKLATALDAAGAKSKTAALKLLDRGLIEFGEDDTVKDDSIVKAIEGLKKAEPILFGEPEDPKAQKQQSGTPGSPSVKPAAQQGGKDDYATELRAAKTMAQITAVMKKYGMA